MDEMTPICQKKDLPLGSSTTCRLESLEPCINGRRYVCCSEFYVVSNECDEPTSYLVQPIVAHCCEVMYFGCFDFRGELCFLNCDDICMCE